MWCTCFFCFFELRLRIDLLLIFQHLALQFILLSFGPITLTTVGVAQDTVNKTYWQIILKFFRKLFYLALKINKGRSVARCP